MSRRIHPSARGILAALVGLLLAAGCAAPKAVPVALTGTTDPAQLEIPQDCPLTGFTLVEPAASQGRFPCALAVARLEQCGDAWSIVQQKVEQSAYWMTTFTTIPEIREVIVFDPLSSPATKPDLAVIDAAARIHEARLCLAYAGIPTEHTHARLAGRITDSEDGSLVAYVSADAGPADFETPRTDRPENDLRHCDVDYLAARRFEAQVQACIAELIARDRRAATTQPSPWQNATPPTVIIVPTPPGGRAPW